MFHKQQLLKQQREQKQQAPNPSQRGFPCPSEPLAVQFRNDGGARVAQQRGVQRLRRHAQLKGALLPAVARRQSGGAVDNKSA